MDTHKISNQEIPAKEVKENFDFNWQFHKGDIAIKKIVKAGGQGGITDVNVKVITKPDTVIDYKDINSYKIFYPGRLETGEPPP